MNRIKNSKPEDKGKDLSAIVELSWEDDCGRAICFDFPISLEIFIIALVLAELEKQDKQK